MRTTLRGLALAALLALEAGLVAPAASHAQEGRSLSIEHFHADVFVSESGALRVEEVIEADFRGSWNGLFRTIPVEYRTPQQLSYRLFLDVSEVTDGQGNPLAYEESPSQALQETQDLGAERE